jgi:hypothetical protein
MAHHRRARARERLGVGPSLAVQRGGHADQNHVGGARRLDAVGQLECRVAALLTQLRAQILRQRRPSAADVRQPARRGFDPHDAQARATQRHRAAQARVAEAHDRDERLGLARLLVCVRAPAHGHLGLLERHGRQRRHRAIVEGRHLQKVDSHDGCPFFVLRAGGPHGRHR